MSDIASDLLSSLPHNTHKANKTSFKKGFPGFHGKLNSMWKGNNVGYSALHSGGMKEE